MLSKSSAFARYRVLIGIAFLLCFLNRQAHASPPPKWKRYVLAGGRYAVMLPNKPQEMTSDTPDRTFTVHLRIARNLIPGAAYSVIYMYFTPKEDRPEPPARKLAEFEATLLGNNKRMVKVTALTLQGYPGKEYRMRFVDKPMVVVCRCYVVGETMYQVIYQAVSTDAHIIKVPPSAIKFLNSFTLLPPARKQS